MKYLAIIPLAALLLASLAPAFAKEGTMQIVLRDYLQESWANELLTYPFSASEGACVPGTLSLAGPKGPVPVQLTDVVLWPDGKTVKTAKVAFIADLTPLATDTYTVQYSDQPAVGFPLYIANVPNAPLCVTPQANQVEITTKAFGARLLLGAKTYPQPVAADQVPGPVVAMRTGDGTWFGGSRMFGPGKITAYAASLTDIGPVFARVAVRYTYEGGNTLDLVMRVVAGDNTIRMETTVAKDQPKDGFNLVISRGLPPLVFQVQDEVRQDRPCFMKPAGYNKLEWADISLQDYVAPKEQPAGLVTRLSPWEDWFGTFTQTRIRLRLDGTQRELQIRSLDPGAWVEPMPIEEIFRPDQDADPSKSQWVGWIQKCLPIMKADTGDIFLQVNAAQGVRKWTISDCLSMPGVAGLMQWHFYKPESAFPPETRPTINTRLDTVKDLVLAWNGDAGSHPRIFIKRPELEALWKRMDVDPATYNELLKYSVVRTVADIDAQYMPNWTTDSAVGAYLLSGGAPDVAEKTMLLPRLRQALSYELWGMQFGMAGSPTPILYDAVVDEPWVPEAERPVLRARMAYYAYRLADASVWSAERGYCSGNQNMTVTWEISRGITACAIPDHPMAKIWYRKAERIMEYFLNNMVGPAGEWPEAMGGHGRTSIDMLLSFAVASTNSGLHNYMTDPRVKRMALWWAKMETPRDPRPMGTTGATPNRRYFPAMGRDCIGFPGGTCGVMARMTRDTDPQYASDLQWAWQEEGGSPRLAHMGGFAYVACDRRLPAQQPAWTSEVFPYAGAVFRHGLGTANEHQVMLYSGDHFAAYYPSHTGSFSGIFAYGTPVVGNFAGSYEYQEGFLTCQVDLARPLGTLEDRVAVYGYHGLAKDVNMWSWPTGQLASFGEHGGLASVTSFATLPRQDYAAVDVAKHFPRRMQLNWKTSLPEWPPVPAKGKPPVDWRRQTLFLKDDDPAKATYLLIRDSVKGNQPTMWQMWNASETIDVPEKVQDVAAVLANKPGNTILPARELKGNRFTAIGQLGVDVDYYIASPVDTPRYTLRWGTEYLISTTNKYERPEYQDLLYLQMPGDGAYFVAFFPRKRGTPAPQFTTLGNGAIIKVSGDFGTDYGFLSAVETAASGDGAAFKGTAASVQNRPGGVVLSLGAKGEVSFQGIGLAADVPASLRLRGNTLRVELPATLQPPAFTLATPFPGATLTLTAPGILALDKPQAGVILAKTATGWALTVPKGCRSVALLRK
jgi:hypothetical protein